MRNLSMGVGVAQNGLQDGSRDDLAKLEQRIAAAKSGREEKPHMEEHYSQAQLAWRMVIELVAGLGIGFGIGYGLDWLFGTLPFLMVIFTFLGLAAGVQTMIRSAKEIQAANMAAPAADEEKRAKDGD
jgi:ATP synthase protein I